MFKTKCKPITKEMYDNAVNGMLAKSDREKVFSQMELFGYGISEPTVHYKNGEYYVSYTDLSERR